MSQRIHRLRSASTIDSRCARYAGNAAAREPEQHGEHDTDDQARATARRRLAGSVSTSLATAGRRRASPSPRPRSPPSPASSIASPSTSPITVPSVKPSVFSTPSSFVRSRTDCAMVLPAISRMTKNTTALIAVRIAPVSPTCLANDWANAFSRRGLGLLGRVGELAVDGLCHLIRLRRVLDLDHVPADRPGIAGALHQILVVEEELRLVDVGGRALVDADEVELERVGLPSFGR